MRYPLAVWTLSVGGILALSPLSVSSTTLPESVVPVVASPVSSPVIIAQVDGDIVDVAQIDGSFRIFLELFETVGMQEDLRGYGRFTVFAPTDSAFAALDEDFMNELLGDRELLAKVLSYHVIASGTPFYADDITATTTHRTLERSDIELRRRRGRILVNDVRVMVEDIEANNGVIHAIDEVLIPPDVIDQIPL